MKCIKCKTDLSEFATQDFAFENIACTECGEEMTVEYDELNHSDGSFESSYWLTKKQE